MTTANVPQEIAGFNEETAVMTSNDSTARKLAVMPKPKKERKAKSRARGTGSLFERGRTYWFELHYGGERFRQSLNVPVTGKTVDRNLALDKMAEAVRAIRSGEAVKKFEPITMRALYDAWMVKVETPGNNKPRTVADYKSRWTAHLEPVFGKLFASQITRDKVAEYKMQRGKEGAGVCTLNREIAVLQMIFNYNREKIPADRFPHFLRELKNVNRETHRQGRLSNADYKILQDRLADPKLFWLKALITLTFKFGFRKSELLNAKVGMFDPTGSVFVLPPYMTKNRKERRVPIARDGEIFKMLVTLTEGRNGEDALFTRNGKPVKDYRGEWEKQTAGMTGGSGKDGHVTIHDLRRSAISNMAHKGVTAAKAGTHLTATVFNLYVQPSTQEEQETARLTEGD